MNTHQKKKSTQKQVSKSPHSNCAEVTLLFFLYFETSLPLTTTNHSYKLMSHTYLTGGGQLKLHVSTRSLTSLLASDEILSLGLAILADSKTVLGREHPQLPPP